MRVSHFCCRGVVCRSWVRSWRVGANSYSRWWGRWGSPAAGAPLRAWSGFTAAGKSSLGSRWRFRCAQNLTSWNFASWARTEWTSVPPLGNKDEVLVTININRFSDLLVKAKMRSREGRAIKAAEKGTLEEPSSIRALFPHTPRSVWAALGTAAGISDSSSRLTLITSRCKRGLGLEKRLFLRAGVF